MTGAISSGELLELREVRVVRGRNARAESFIRYKDTIRSSEYVGKYFDLSGNVSHTICLLEISVDKR